MEEKDKRKQAFSLKIAEIRHRTHSKEMQLNYKARLISDLIYTNHRYSVKCRVY